MEDFDALKTEHVILKHKIKRFLNGKGKMDGIDILTHKQCKLGKWLYAEALKKHGKTIPELKELEKVHIEFHVFLKEIVVIRSNRPNAEVQNLVQALGFNSDKIIDLVNTIRSKIVNTA